MNAAQVLGNAILLLTLLCLFFAGACWVADYLHKVNAESFKWWDDQ